MRIDRTIEIQAPPERVWRALTSAAELSAWFEVKIEGEITPGNEVWMTSTHAGHAGMRFRVRFVEMTAPRRFAWQWCPGARIVLVRIILINIEPISSSCIPNLHCLIFARGAGGNASSVSRPFYELNRRCMSSIDDVLIFTGDIPDLHRFITAGRGDLTTIWRPGKVRMLLENKKLDGARSMKCNAAVVASHTRIVRSLLLEAR